MGASVPESLLFFIIPSLFGFLFQGYLLYILWSRRSFHNVFGFFNFTRTLIYCILMLIFAGPITMEVYWPGLTPDHTSYFLGYFIMSLDVAAHYILVCMGISRLFAVYFPVKYKNYFTENHGKIYIMIVFIVSFTFSCSFLLPDCHHFFSGELKHFMWSSTTCGSILASAQDLYQNILLTVISISLNILTFNKIWQMKKEFEKRTNMEHQLSKRSFKYLSQTFTAESLTLVYLLGSYLISNFLDRELSKKILVFAWILNPQLNGFVLVFLYPEFRNPFTPPSPSIGIINSFTPPVVGKSPISSARSHANHRTTVV